MPDLLEMRADRLGVKLLRLRTLDPFAHITAEDGPLLDMLFTLTRPPEKTRQKRLREVLAQAPPPPPPNETGPTILPKGMVPYRRELWGTHDLPN